MRYTTISALVYYIVPILTPVLLRYIFNKSRKKFAIDDKTKNEIKKIYENKDHLKVLKKYFKIHAYLMLSIWFIWITAGLLVCTSIAMRYGIVEMLEKIPLVFSILIYIFGFIIIFLVSIGFFTLTTRPLVMYLLKIYRPEINPAAYRNYSLDTMMTRGKQASVSKTYNIDAMRFEEKWEYYNTIIFLTALAVFFSTIAYLKFN